MQCYKTLQMTWKILSTSEKDYDTLCNMYVHNKAYLGTSNFLSLFYFDAVEIVYFSDIYR